MRVWSVGEYGIKISGQRALKKILYDASDDDFHGNKNYDNNDEDRCWLTTDEERWPQWKRGQQTFQHYQDDQNTNSPDKDNHNTDNHNKDKDNSIVLFLTENWHC